MARSALTDSAFAPQQCAPMHPAPADRWGVGAATEKRASALCTGSRFPEPFVATTLSTGTSKRMRPVRPDLVAL